MRYHEFTPQPETVSARIADGQGVTAVAEPGSSLGSPPAPSRPSRDLPTTLAGLTALRDREFVDAAYRVILGREPDAAGSAPYLAGLRAGTLDKIDVLGDLRYSSEGEQRAVRLDGLKKRYTLRRFGRLPAIGGIVRWLLALLRLPMLVQATQRQQAEMELAQTVTESHAAAIQQFQRGELFGQIRRLSTRLETVETALRELAGDLRTSQRDLRETFEARHERLANANARLMQQLRATNLAVSAGAIPGRPPVVPSPSDGQLAAGTLDAIYVDFEDRFRGSREETNRSHETYLD